ncbi:SMC-Scp complex subunit ScpB [Streptococcus sciuri]|uniref:Segregation and condensation protein B n=1 Tax=Streptococcus sciuri TaxID=2973939 RepID=A0ABT2FAG4_9STRE|nr:SMC-Scp complex subunit ScpB [Streptococcus sciuri]MCS4488832.1 SMC-Scp complex subunit ScpB [Streptococcus sciuri]
MNYLARLEALLFVAGEDGLSFRQLVELLDLSPTALTQQLEKLANRYEKDEDSSLCLLETSQTYKLVTKDSLSDLLRVFSTSPINQSLSRASLEVLSIIAYKQPITRIEIDDIRGVNSSGAISKLQAFGLIKEIGKKEVVGRPKIYATTDYFLDYMGINHLDELMDVSNIQLVDQELTLFNLEENERKEE